MSGTVKSATSLGHCDGLKGKRTRRRPGAAGSLGLGLPALAVVLLPTCPVCLGAYLGVMSSVGLTIGPTLVHPLLVGTLFVSLVITSRDAVHRRRLVAAAAIVAGASLVILGKYAEGAEQWSNGGLVLLVIGALSRVVTVRRFEPDDE